MIVEDLAISGKRVFLLVPKRKMQYIEGGRIITTNQEARWFLRLDDETVYRIDKRKLEDLALQKLDSVPAPKHMSVDEVAWHKYVTNVVDVDQRKVIWNHQGRGKVNLDKFFRVWERGTAKRLKL